MRSYILVALLFCGSLPVSSETNHASSMLSATLAKYANLSTYYVQGTRELSMTDEVQHTWQQERFTVARASANRYHYDVKIPDRWNVVVANGITEWDFQPWRNEYTQRPVPNKEPDSGDPDDVIRHVAAAGARFYAEDLSRIKIQRAEFLPEENLTLAGQQIPCYVIRATYQYTEGYAPKHPARLTFWIEKERRLIRKETVVQTLSPSVLQPLREVDQVDTIYYTVVSLGGLPPSTLFNFSPPNGAKQVRRLFFNDRSIDLTGLSAPPLNLKTLDGIPFDPTSLKGHVVLVDFWASWCVPCVQQMQSLSKLAQKLSKEGLIVIGVDWGDDDLNAAREFLNKNHYDWTNLRGNSETATAWMLNGVPLVALIDPAGKIVYYHNGYEEPEGTAIVNALQKINPSFSSGAALCQ
jgi:thiol-disulfide isomerase/thioredoxin